MSAKTFYTNISIGRPTVVDQKGNQSLWAIVQTICRKLRLTFEFGRTLRADSQSRPDDVDYLPWSSVVAKCCGEVLWRRERESLSRLDISSSIAVDIVT